jgi:hypothetical protein
LGTTRYFQFRFQAATLVIALLQVLSGCSRDNNTRVKIELADPPAGKGTQAAAPMPDSLQCPPAGAPTLQPSASTGHHGVVFTWNASVPSTRPEDNAVGYCLYRSKTKNAAKANANCSGCEQINSIPVSGRGCVDDLVEDGSSYYYVVTAISVSGKTSSSSNEISVVIPDAQKSARSKTTASYPSCRAASIAK